MVKDKKIFMEEMRKYEKEKESSLAQLMDSIYNIAEVYLTNDDVLSERYDHMLDDYMNKELIKLDRDAQDGIYDIVYGRSRSICQIGFLLGMQMGVSLLNDIKNGSIIQKFIDSNIIV